MSLENKTVVITGAAMGIGRAAALCCAEAGGRTVLADIEEAGLKETFGDIHAAGGEASCQVVDVSGRRAGRGADGGSGRRLRTDRRAHQLRGHPRGRLRAPWTSWTRNCGSV